MNENNTKTRNFTSNQRKQPPNKGNVKKLSGKYHLGYSSRSKNFRLIPNVNELNAEAEHKSHHTSPKGR